MAVRIGVGMTGSGVKGRREPCAKCGYPVFLAERLNVGTKLYHRTCFRCARCNNQLSLANCYETETDGQYCCETCPDEEEGSAKIPKTDSSDTLKSDKFDNSTKADSNSTKVDGLSDTNLGTHSVDIKRQRLDQMRNRSLSDEEKSKGLQQCEEDEYSAHFENALEESNKKTHQDDSLVRKARNTFLSSHLLEEEMNVQSAGQSEGRIEPDVPPPLPVSKPPNASLTSLTTLSNLDKPVPVDSAASSDSPPLEHSVHNIESNATDIDRQRQQFDSSVIVNSTDKISDKSDQQITASDTTLEDTTNLRDKNSTKDTNRSSLVKSRMLMFETGEPVAKLASPNSDKDKVSAVSKYFSSNKNVQKKTDRTDNKNRVPLSSSEYDLAKPDISEITKSTKSKSYDSSLPLTIQQFETVDENLEDARVESSLVINNSSAKSTERPMKLITKHETDQNDSKSEIYLPESLECISDEVKENSMDPNFINDISNTSVNMSEPVEPRATIDNVVNKSSDSLKKEYSIEEPAELAKDFLGQESKSLTTSVDLKIEITKADESDPRGEETRNASIPSKDDALEEIYENYETVRSELISDNLVVEPSVIEGNTPVSKPTFKLDPKMQKILTKSILEDLSFDQSEVSLDASILDSSVTSKSETEYPEDLNPFGDDDGEDSAGIQNFASRKLIRPSKEDLNISTPAPIPRKNKTKSAERKSTNPFGSSDEDEEGKGAILRTKPPRPPLPSARGSDDNGGPKKLLEAPKVNLNPFWTSEDEPSDEETNSILKPVPLPRSKTLGTPEPKPRRSGMSNNADRYDSNSSLSSLNSSISHTPGRKKKPAPPPPPPSSGQKSIGASISPQESKQTSPSTSTQPSPKLTPRIRKSRKAPLPPSSTPFVDARVSESTDISPIAGQPVVESFFSPNESKLVNETQVGNTMYFSPADSLPSIDVEKEKINKDEKNRNRQSQSIASPISDSDSLSLSQSPAMDKSTHGKWKRKKGPAPARPVPQRRQIKPLPLVELRRELDIIEMQQQGLEKQGVKLEQLIREKCEAPGVSDETALSPEVEDLVLELFELVNEKNELFRRQAELMYLRRQQRLEEEYADLEYQIRCLMDRPERNKTDSDKAREEELINRLVEVVERRNEIVECLEMDRVREAEEDQSIHSRLSLMASKRDEENNQPESPVKLSKKEKKKMKKEKKLKEKGKALDMDKDIDESESNTTNTISVVVKEKKKKKWF